MGEKIEDAIAEGLRSSKRTPQKLLLTERLLDESAERNDVDPDEIEEFLSENYQKDDSEEYLVDGAILTCTCSTKQRCDVKENAGEDKYPYTAEFNKDINNESESFVRGMLTVTENQMYINGLKYATIADCVEDENIPYFGNCKNPPYTEAEKEVFRGIHRSPDAVAMRKAGTCRYLMNLESAWENYVTKNGYLGYTDDDGVEKPGITMTSVLFCKHGGFVYPVASGQNSSVVNEEIDEEIAMKILEKYLSEGIFDAEQVENALNYLALRSSYMLNEYDEGDGNDYNRYDNYILGWNVYYNRKMNMDVDPNYLKSQIYEESNMGYTSHNAHIPAANSKTDIMQALDIRNYNIYDYIEILPQQFLAITSYKENGKYVYMTGSEIWQLNLGGSGYSEPSDGRDVQKKKERCGGIIATLFNTEKDGTGETYTKNREVTYYYINENVTPIMSIGVGFDKIYELLEKNNMDYERAFTQYNTKMENYASNIINRAESKVGKKE